MPFPTLDFTLLDWILWGGLAFFTVVGLFRGLSGELGSLAGFIAALATGYWVYHPLTLVTWVSDPSRASWLPLVLSCVFALVAFGLVRWILSRFVRTCLGPWVNTLLGGCAGFAKGLLVIGILSSFGLIQSATFSSGLFPSHSVLIHTITEWTQSYQSGAKAW